MIACGECRRELNLNKYLTGISTEASVDSPPGSATVTLSVPDNDINEFYVDGNLVIIPMMEIELFSKGYFTVGGFPQYYRIFWGIVSSVQKAWSNGVTTITLNCKDILRWWELTNVTTQSAFLEASKSQGGWNLFQNRFAGTNPYTVIITLAKEAMGDFSLTTGSFTSFKPEDGPEKPVIAQYAKDIMAYWQLKFGNIWNNLVLYGTSGQAYTFSGDPGNVSPLKISKQIFDAESKSLNLNPETGLFKIQPHEIAAVKVDVSRAADVNFFENETQSKLSMALTARDQAGAYEFYCDSTGDIVFKPPFYNLNVLPNKPVSWIQDFEIIDDSITDSEAEVFTHVTSSGNAFGGVTDWGLNDEITTPRTGVVDWHLLKRYGWRRMDVQLEWAGNPKKLFYHLLDHIDKVNAKRVHGSVTIPMRPELRMGFPVWFPRYDSFFYVNSISHNYSPGGQATTQLNLIARRQKFIAPKNIGSISRTGSRTVEYVEPKSKEKFTRTHDTYSISFPSDVGSTAGLNDTGQTEEFGGPAVLRDPRTGKLLGFPNVVMVYRSTLSGKRLAEILQKAGDKKGNKPKQQDKKSSGGASWAYDRTIGDTFVSLQNERRAEVIDRLRIHRYESGMTNAGAYDYAHDTLGSFKEYSVIPTDKINWGAGTIDPNTGVPSVNGPPAGAQSVETKDEEKKILGEEVKRLEAQLPPLQTAFNEAKNTSDKAEKEFQQFMKGSANLKENKLDEDQKQRKELVDNLKAETALAAKALEELKSQIKATKSNQGRVQALRALNVMVRPVSDEFGFEVVGHNRYGRGAFIDRGQLQIPDPNSVGQNQNFFNELNVQFAAQGGLLTDPATQNSNNLGPESPNFAEAYEKMQPDDYVTGATFKGANYNNDQRLEEVNPTGVQTYDSSLRQATSKGTAVFAEADALKRAITLAELKPTTSGPLDEAISEKCGCDLGRADWLSVLPQSFIRRVLDPSGARGTGGSNTIIVDGQEKVLSEDGTFDPDNKLEFRDSGNGEKGIFNKVTGNIISGSVTRDDGAFVADDGTVIWKPQTEMVGPIQGNRFDLGDQNPGQFRMTSTDSFFSVLREFLLQRFNRDYEENKAREQFAINGGVERFAPNLDEQDNIIPPPNNTLFDRASQGDPDALEALAAGANFNWGKSEQALKDFKDKITKKEPDNLVDPTKKDPDTLADLSGSVFLPSKGLVKVGDGEPGVISADKLPPPQWQPPVGPIIFPEIVNSSIPEPAPDELAGSSVFAFSNQDVAPEGEGTPVPEGPVPDEDT